MKECFADTVYWVALINPRDQWYDRVMAAGPILMGTLIVSTDAVLHEVLAHYSAFPPQMRLRAVEFVRAILANPSVEVIPPDRPTFLAALDLYEARPDKGYSLTDGLSMDLMRERAIKEVLTSDAHFAQEGFVLLLR